MNPGIGTNTLRDLARRRLLQAGGLSLFGLSLPELLAAREINAAIAASTDHPQSAIAPGKAKACILLFMWGGPAHQDTWDLKPEAPAEVRGQFSPIATSVPGIQICEHFPLLAQRAEQLAIIRSMTHTNVDHTQATHFLLTGQPPLPGKTRSTDWPSMGSVLSRLKFGHGPLPPYVAMRPTVPGDVPRFVEESRGQFAGWLGQRFDPLLIDADPNAPDYRVGEFASPADVSAARLSARRQLLDALQTPPVTSGNSHFGNASGAKSISSGPTIAMQSHYERAFALIDSAVGRSAFDLTQEPTTVRERYGLNPHGQSVLQARRLVERGVPLVTVFWPNDGIKNVSVYWDTHSRNFIDLRERLMPTTDQAFSALLDDLADRGMLDETLVVWTGEFGRTPRIGQQNSDAGAASDGRDHWPGCFTSVLAGGGSRGGTVYGSSDRHAAFPVSNATNPVDLVATVYRCLGLPPDLVLQDAEGRSIPICPGSPITDVLN